MAAERCGDSGEAGTECKGRIYRSGAVDGESGDPQFRGSKAGGDGCQSDSEWEAIVTMPDGEQHEMPFQQRRIKNPKLRRGIFLIPAVFTSANLLCGYYAIVASLAGAPEDFNHAAKAIGLAILFVSLDGRVARMTGTKKEFGVQFDSLADVVSFGVAPALMAYAWGVRSLPGQDTLAVEQIS